MRAFSSKGKMLRVSPRRTDGQRRMLSSGEMPRTRLSRTMRRSRRLSVVEPWSFSPPGRADRAEMYTPKMRSRSMSGVRAGLSAWMPSMKRMSPASNLRVLPSKTRWPALKSNFGISTSLPASRSVSCSFKNFTSIASRAS